MIVGGVVPKEYIPSIDKGIQEALNSGVLAGYPVEDVKVELIDGSWTLAIGYLRLAHVRLDLELTQQAIDDDLEVQLAHAGDDGLTSLMVGWRHRCCCGSERHLHR